VAIAAKRRGHEAIILSLVPPKRSHSKAAQGGMQASLGNVIKGQGDNEDVHFEDTVRGSDWGADQEVVRMFVNTAPKAVRELAAWGVPWSRVQQGDRVVVINGQNVTITERRRRTGSWRSATSAARRSGAPATSPTAPATRCCRRSATGRSPNRSPCSSAPRRSPSSTTAAAATARWSAT
jgi:succinate dehydrogenase/fumarate reductase flavoprotein subunit